MTRALAPDDLYRLRIATDPRLSPDGATPLVTLQTAAPSSDGYRHAIWLVPLDGDGGEPRQLTLGAKHDGHARWLAGRPDARVPLGPPAPGRGGAGRRSTRRTARTAARSTCCRSTVARPAG